MLRLCVILLLLALLAIAPPAWAQGDTCLHRTLPLGIDVPRGFADTQIPIADFQGKLRGKPVKILSVVPDQRPHRIVMLIDASGSMEKFWSGALSLASGLADSRLPNTRMAMLLFGEGTKEEIGFSEGQAAIIERLRQLRSAQHDSKKLVKGKTSIYDAVLAGLALLDSPTSADCLYLISDGEENTSRANLNQVTQRLTSSRVRLFFSFMERAALGGRGTIDEAQGGQVSELVQKTGGETWKPLDYRALWDTKESARFAEARNAFEYGMVHSYLLELELPETLRKPKSWELELAGEHHKKWKDVRLSYPTELPACGP
jgi:VWA domain containing CoxE-like protein